MDSRDHWQLQTAKNRFSEVVRLARTRGPQFVTQRGVEAVVVMGIEDYRALTEPKTPSVSFTSYLLGAPRGDALDVERSDEGPRSDGEME